MSRSKRKKPARYGAVALITGASDGIGAAFSEELARQGYDLILVARRDDRLRARAEHLQSKYGVRARHITADLGKSEDLAQLIAQTAGDDVGLLVAAAGYGTSGYFAEQPIGPELDMIDVNCRAVVALTHAFAQRFKRRGSGGIVLFGSLVGFQGVPRAANYAASKAFIQTFVEGLRPELRPYGIDVISVAPGPIASGFAARANMVMGAAAKPASVPRETMAALGRKTTVRPGFLSKALEALFFGLPRGARTLIMTQVMKSMARGAANKSPASPL